MKRYTAVWNDNGTVRFMDSDKFEELKKLADRIFWMRVVDLQKNRVYFNGKWEEVKE